MRYYYETGCCDRVLWDKTTTCQVFYFCKLVRNSILDDANTHTHTHKHTQLHTYIYTYINTYDHNKLHQFILLTL